MKNSKQHEISMSYRVESAPRGWTAGDAIRAMIDAIREGSGMLPQGFKATWKIRDSQKDFGDTIRSANPGLKTLMVRRLLRDLKEVL